MVDARIACARMQGAAISLTGVIVLSMSFLASSVHAADKTASADIGMAAIHPHALEGHVTFLADDLLEGRGNGSRGYDLAAHYVATRFQGLDLAPAAPGGSYLQPVPLRTATLLPEESGLAVNGRDGKPIPFHLYDDFVMGGNAAHLASQANGKMVFVGFGVSAPEQEYDDYDGVNVGNRIVVYFSGAPASFPDNQRAYYSSGRVKARNAIARGAVGVITIRSPTDAVRSPWERTVRQSRMPSMRWLQPDETPADAYPEIRGSAYMNLAAGKRLLAAAGIDLDESFSSVSEGRPQSRALSMDATLRQRSSHEAVASPNVIGMLPGSDEKLRDEYVVYTAHLDHLGIAAAKDGDAIYNGAYDNATGIAMLIETARAFAALPVAPARSILFLATAGEERGLLGAEYYARHADSPMDRIVANVNLDMPLLLFPFSDVVAFGGQHSSLGSVTERAARRLGFDLAPDPFPEEVVFIRSDQYAFVRQGVPAVFLVTGTTSSDPEIDGRATFVEFLQNGYHSPTDDLNNHFDWDTGARFTRANFLLGLEIANDPVAPSWNEGDFFGERFGARR